MSIKRVTEAKPNQQSLGADLKDVAYGGGSSYMPRRSNGRAGDSAATPQARIMKRGSGKLHGSYPASPQRIRGR